MKTILFVIISIIQKAIVSVAFQIVTKTEIYRSKNKNEILRNQLEIMIQQNQIKVKYIYKCGRNIQSLFEWFGNTRYTCPTNLYKQRLFNRELCPGSSDIDYLYDILEEANIMQKMRKMATVFQSQVLETLVWQFAVHSMRILVQ
jgi:hypothetical protein